MGDLPVWADRPRAGDGRRMTVPKRTWRKGLDQVAHVGDLLTPAWLMRRCTQPDRDLGMPDESGQHLGLTVDSVQLLDQYGSQFVGVIRREVGEPAMLGMLPHHLVGIGLGGVA